MINEFKAQIYQGLGLKVIDPSCQTDELCSYAIRKNPLDLQYVENKKEHLCLLALKTTSEPIKFIPQSIMNIGIVKRMLINQDSHLYINYIPSHFLKNIDVLKQGVAQNKELLNCLEEPEILQLAMLLSIRLDKIPKQKWTPSLIKEMIELNPNNFYYVENPSEELCILAVTLNASCLKAIKNQTEAITKAAINTGILKCFDYLQVVPKESYLYILKHRGDFLKKIDIKDLTYEMCVTAVTCHRTAIKHVPEKFQTEEICQIAIKKNNGQNLKYIKNPSVSVMLNALDTPNALQYVKNPTYEMCKKAVLRGGYSLEHVPVDLIDQELVEASLNKKDLYLEFIPKHLITHDLIIKAITLNLTNLKHINKEYLNDDIIAFALSKDFKRVLSLIKDKYSIDLRLLVKTVELNKNSINQIQQLYPQLKLPYLKDEAIKALISMYEKNKSIMESL